MDAVGRYGAHFVGLNFFEPSPRYVSPADAAMLAARSRPDLTKVGLFVDPDDDTIDQVLSRVPLDLIQLHGKESPGRCAAVSARTGRPIVKALHVRGADDLEQARHYRDVVEWLMFEGKPPKDATRPGGNASAFDWTLMTGADVGARWMLAGGVNPDNVATALRLTGAPAVDVSSGVESGPGKKDVGKIRAFLEAVAAIR